MRPALNDLFSEILQAMESLLYSSLESFSNVPWPESPLVHGHSSRQGSSSNWCCLFRCHHRRQFFVRLSFLTGRDTGVRPALNDFFERLKALESLLYTVALARSARFFWKIGKIWTSLVVMKQFIPPWSLIIIINDTLARSLEPVVTECKEHTIHTQTQIVASRKPKEIKHTHEGEANFTT